MPRSNLQLSFHCLKLPLTNTAASISRSGGHSRATCELEPVLHPDLGNHKSMARRSTIRQWDMQSQRQLLPKMHTGSAQQASLLLGGAWSRSSFWRQHYPQLALYWKRTPEEPQQPVQKQDGQGDNDARTIGDPWGRKEGNELPMLRKRSR